MAIQRLDEKDHIILDLLKKNSRSSVREIAKATGYKPSTVHQRIQKLIKSGVIENFTLKVNNSALGKSFVVFMLVSTEKVLHPDAFRDGCIREVHGVTGEFDLLYKMRFSDVDEFNSFILSYRKDYDLKKTITMVVTTTLKDEV